MTRPALPDIDDCMIAPERHLLHPAELRLRRTIVDHLELWLNCPRRACRSAGACRSRIVACFDEERPAIAAVMTSFLYEGYLDEDGIEI